MNSCPWSINGCVQINLICVNIEKTNFIVFHPAQKKINYSLILKMQEQQIREKQSIKYLLILT
jgi:hypothetical protein